MISMLCLKLKMVKYCGLLVYGHCELTGITVCGPWYLRICLQDEAFKLCLRALSLGQTAMRSPKKIKKFGANALFLDQAP